MYGISDKRKAVFHERNAMNIIIKAFILLAAIGLEAPSHASAQVDGSSSSGHQAIQILRKRVRENGGCNVNLCFALDGSGSVSPKEFGAAKMIVSLVSRVITVDEKARLSAVQYAAANTAISPLTRNVKEFLQNVDDARRSSEEESFIGGGILYCADQIRAFPDGSNKLVLLGDGQNTLGFDPFDRADTFRELGGEIFAVGIGNVDKSVLRRILKGNVDNLILFDVNDEGKSIVDVVVDAVSGICDVDKPVLETFPE